MNHEQDSAKEIIAYLEASTAEISPDLLASLADSRERAVTLLARHHELAAGASRNGVAGVLRLFGETLQQHRIMMSAGLVASAVFVAFLVTQQFSGQQALDHGDAFLLASELPPEAYLDRGFDVWLERTSQQ